MKRPVGMDKAKVWISENVGTKMATKLFRGLALGALLVAATGLYFSINQGEAGSPLASEQGACYPLYPELGPCASEWIAVAPTIADRNDRGMFEVLGLFDEILPEDLKQGAAVSPITSEQGACYPLYPELGPCWFMVEQGKEGKGLSTAKVYAEIDDGEAMVIYGYPASIFYALNQGKVASPSSIDLNEVWTEIEDTPVHHLMKQLIAGS